ncbi:MAG: sensor histidine kinase N-terminal domain-containing protein, partial [Thauera sp.]
MLPLRRKSRPERAPRGANPPRKSGPPNSLFGEILDWMLAPLLFLWPISIIVTHNVADSIANQPYDLALADGVRALARLVEVEDEQIVVRFPAPPRALFRADQDDVVYFQVADVNGVTVSGDAEIPPMPTSSAQEGEEVQLRDGMIHGEEVRIAWRFVRPDAAQADRFVLVQVAETRNKRTDLASRVVTGVLLPQFAIIPLAVVLVWVGLSRGIAPLNRLQ